VSAGRRVESRSSRTSRGPIPSAGPGRLGKRCPISREAAIPISLVRRHDESHGWRLSFRRPKRENSRGERWRERVARRVEPHGCRWGGDTDRACHRAQFKSNLRHDRVSWSLVVARQLPRLRPLRQSGSNRARARAPARGRSLTPLSAECGSLRIGKTRREGQGRCAPSPVQKCGTRDRPRRESHGRIKDRADTSVSRSIASIDRRIGRRSALRSHAGRGRSNRYETSVDGRSDENDDNDNDDEDDDDDDLVTALLRGRHDER